VRHGDGLCVDKQRTSGTQGDGSPVLSGNNDERYLSKTVSQQIVGQFFLWSTGMTTGSGLCRDANPRYGLHRQQGRHHCQDTYRMCFAVGATIIERLDYTDDGQKL